MGLGLIGAMGGVGDAGVQYGQMMMRSAENRELEEWKAKILMEKQKALMDQQEQHDINKENRAVDRANTEREAKVKRVNEAKTGLINSAIGGKYAGSDAAVADADAGNTDMPLTKEQRDVIQQSKDADRAKLSNDPMLAFQAGHETGDVSDKDYASVVLGERRADRQEKRDVQQQAYQTAMLALKERGLDIQDKRVEAMMAKMASGGGSSNVSAFIQNFDKVKKETGWSSEDILKYLNQAKTPGDSYTQTEEYDPILDQTKTKTTRKGAGSPMRTNVKLDELFPSKK